MTEPMERVPDARDFRQAAEEGEPFGFNGGRMCQVVASKMLQTLKTCTLYPKASKYFESAASRGDCDAIWAYYSRLVRDRKDVGRGIQSSGGRPIEHVRSEIEHLYEYHRANTKP